MAAAVFLTWIEHRRTRAICERLGVELAELVSRRRGVARYAELTLRTLKVLLRRRPRVLIVQTPSQVLGLLALFLRPCLGYRLILDAHNEAVEPYLHPSPMVKRLTYLLLRRADRVIVSNAQLASAVIERGGKPLVLPDALPSPPLAARTPPDGPFVMAVISTYAGDEPVAAIVEAARELGDDVRLFITGNDRKCPPEVRERLPANVTLTGFLDEHAYWELLASAHAVMDLTTMEDCLVCGAYEAVALGKPLVLSDNRASRELFAGFATFADNTPRGIAESVRELRAGLDGLHATFPTRRIEFDAGWERRADELRALLS